MLVTFGTKMVNTGFVQIFGSKILKDFDQPFFQNNNVFSRTQGYQIGDQ